ncbi:MAG: enolase C-terminal domain-like protein [Aurantimonas endophytica]|uniref:Galactonate dehydratase n=1 Tax=Aurantimonas endophytica TaxID=1522175 RepID=A0A7W6MPZ3_9HYPH|nr:enolase C-terminal domain-like protein [Aurantimonas endophytica]MBB4003407.1 galactonate dehydratase [Aurantimonas endophytica]
MSSPTPIRITGVTTLVVNAEMRNWIFVKVQTDQDGLYGWGEASLNWKTRAVAATVEDLEPLLIGKDPRDIEQIVRILNKHSYYKLGIIGATAISGIEHALWDIFGKSVGLPVWRLLGGQTRNEVRVYTHLGLGDMRSVYETFDEGALRDKALAVVEKGYDALKVVFIPYSHYSVDIPSRRHVGRLMKVLREAVGESVDIMVDFHGRPATVAGALQYIEELAPYSPMFCEEPVQPGDTQALRMVTERANCPIASGERLVGYKEFEPLFEQKALHIIQPDLNHTGGILEGKKIAAAAEQAMMGVAPHNPNGPIAGAAALHYDISIPNFVIQEEMSGAVPWYDDVVSTPMRRVGSAWQIPHAPGLGVEINEAEAAKHPFKPEVMHTLSAVLGDGTIVDW